MSSTPEETTIRPHTVLLSTVAPAAVHERRGVHKKNKGSAVKPEGDEEPRGSNSGVSSILETVNQNRET
ncbi:unnamed protein product [Boreogadus saida]